MPAAGEDDPLGRDVSTLGPAAGRRPARAGGRGRVRAGRGATRAHQGAARGGGLPRRTSDEAGRRPARADCGPDACAQARLLVRAFTSYFHLVNMAEEHHRLRVLRQREMPRAGGAPRVESVAEAVAEAARSGVGADAVLRAFLERCAVEPVFTAHPTEARRRTVLQKLRADGQARGGPRRSPPPARRGGGAPRPDARGGRRAVAAPRRSAASAPTVLDEVRNGLFYFEESLWDVVPRLLPRDGGGAGRAPIPGEAVAVPAVPPLRLLDGRRPRRPPPRDRRGHRGHAAACRRRPSSRSTRGSWRTCSGGLSVRAESPRGLPRAGGLAGGRRARAARRWRRALGRHFEGEPFRRKAGLMLARVAGRAPR